MIRKTGASAQTLAAAAAIAPRRRLDRAAVLDAARALSNTAGLDGLSIKVLAATLGIRPPSLYAHFDGLAELRRALALRGYQLLAARLQATAVGLAGPQALIAMGHSYLEFIRLEPGLYAATIPTPDQEDTELRAAADAWLGVFRKVLDNYGLTLEESIHALRGIRSIVHGFGVLEMQGAFRTAIDRNVSFAHVLQTFVAAISPR